MKKLFISQPMNGRTDEEIIAEREKTAEIAKDLLGEEVLVIDSFFQNMPTEEGFNRRLYLLGRSLELMAAADMAIFAPGWGDARGCRIERVCAEEYGIPVLVIEG